MMNAVTIASLLTADSHGLSMTQRNGILKMLIADANQAMMLSQLLPISFNEY